MFEGLSLAVAKTAIKGFFGKNWEILLLLAALGGACWYLDHRGYERAKAADAARLLEQQQITQAVVRQVDGELTGKLAAIATSSSDKIQTIDTEGRTVVQPIITRELVRDPALAGPGSCLTPGLLEAVNAARGYLLDDHLAGANTGSGKPAPVPAGGKGH